MKSPSILQTAYNFLQPNPEPSSKLLDKMREFDRTIFVLRQKTHHRFSKLFQQLRDANLDVRSTYHPDTLLCEDEADIEQVQTAKPVLACVEPTIVRRPNTVFTCLRQLSLKYQEAGVARSAFVWPGLSHSLTRNGNGQHTLYDGYKTLVNDLEQWNVQIIECKQTTRPIDLLTASVEHHTRR